MTSAASDLLPLSATAAPTDEASLADVVRQAASDRCPVYPIGGGTRLAYGVLPAVPGIGLATTGLDGLIDHAADDMTVTVEAGMRLSALEEALALRRQRLPIDSPSQATIGGLIATNSFGPRRFGHRTIRDYLIGLRAVDGQGQAFAAGGRVVKNAAGYDIGRLLIGSLGTMGVLTQVSLMVRPMAEASAMIAAGLPDLDAADSLLARLHRSAVRPVSIDVLTRGWGADDDWGGDSDSSIRLLIGLEGSRTEVDWMIAALRRDWTESSARDVKVLGEVDTAAMWQWMTELPAQLQANLLPSKALLFVRRMTEIDPGSAAAVYAGDGVVRIRLSADAATRMATVLASKIRPAVEELEGRLAVLSVSPGSGLGRDDVWGPAAARPSVMHALKERFDPFGILNPGRWVL